MNRKALSGYNVSLDAALKQGGFYGPTGIWNSLVKIDGKILRGRVEVIVLKKELQQMYMRVINFNKRKYRLPGGSFEKDVPNYIQAQNEVLEEARLKIKNVINTGMHYTKIYTDKQIIGVENHLKWQGSYTEVYVAEYDSPYTGFVDKEDEDQDMYENGIFYDISEAYPILSEVHKRVIDDIFPVLKKSEINESMILLKESDNNVHYYPYYTPAEMHALGVHNESKNRFSDIDDEAIEWYYEYTDTLHNPQSKEWLQELFMRYKDWAEEPSAENAQALLNIGWNPMVPASMENALIVSRNTEKRINEEMLGTTSKAIFIDETTSIFSKNDIVKNFDDFDNGKSNILLITGMAGSGKTTLASQLSEEYDADLIQLDYFQCYEDTVNDQLGSKDDPGFKIIQQYVKENKLEKEAIRFSSIRLDSFEKYFTSFFKWLIARLKKDKNKKYIVEGVHIMLYTKYKDISKLPLICVQTSTIKSLVRHWIRDDWSLEDVIKHGYDDILLFSSWNNKYNTFRKDLKESAEVIQETKAYKFADNQRLYFLSQMNMDNELLIPRVPKNYMTNNSFEDNVTKRVCFSTSIDGCLRGMSKNIKGMKFYVHVPEDGQRFNIIKPAVAHIPDQIITGEEWVLDKVNVKCIGQIEVIDSDKNGLPYQFKEYKYTKGRNGLADCEEIPGAKVHSAELYNWKWKWAWKDDNISLEEASGGKGRSNEDIKPKDIDDINKIIDSLGPNDYKDFTRQDYAYYYKIEYDKGQPIGFVRLVAMRDRVYKHARIVGVSIAVVPEYRKKGIAKKLVQGAVTFAKKDKYLYRITWGANRINIGSINLAKSCGFKIDPNSGDKDYMALHIVLREPVNVDEQSSLNEGYIRDNDDIYYNKELFDSGKINLCFITGLSGSGKSTMGRNMSGSKVEHYEMDDVICNDNFSDNNLKEYGDLISSFFNGPGKSFRLVRGDDKHNDEVFKSHENYDKEITQAFVKHAISFCKSHKNTKYVCDGIWIFMFIQPSQLKDCAVYIKGTSTLKSGYRALKRDIEEDKRNGMTALQIFKHEFKRVKEDVLYARKNQSDLNSFRNYFKKAITNESAMKRSELDDSEFGLPKLRKYPMPDEDHVLSAIKFFNYVSPENEKELARNIKKRMKKYGISTDRVGKKNRLRKYLIDDADMIPYLLEAKKDTPFYFYHLVPKNSDISKGIVSPRYMYNNGMDDILTPAIDKYRDRLVDFDKWNIYPDKDPSELTTKEILDGLDNFRGIDGSSQIYLFRFPPYGDLGRNMKEILKHKDIYRIDLNDSQLKRYIKYIDWGYVGSDNRNAKLTRSHYENISPEEYFSKYNDTDKPLFRSLHHISVVMKDAYIPKKFLTKINYPSSLQEFAFDNFENTRPVLVFDLGSVLIDSTMSFEEALTKSSKISNELVSSICEYINNTCVKDKDKLEYCEEADYYRYMIDHAPDNIKKYIPTALAIDTEILKPFSYTESLLGKLKCEGYKLYYISNWSKWSRDALLRKGTLDFLRHFDGGIFSCDVHICKPNKGIFVEFFAKYTEMAPCDTYFFDDNSDNISAAISVGMNGILFNKDFHSAQWIADTFIAGNPSY